MLVRQTNIELSVKSQLADYDINEGIANVWVSWCTLHWLQHEKQPSHELIRQMSRSENKERLKRNQIYLVKDTCIFNRK